MRIPSYRCRECQRVWQRQYTLEVCECGTPDPEAGLADATGDDWEGLRKRHKAPIRQVVGPGEYPGQLELSCDHIVVLSPPLIELHEKETITEIGCVACWREDQ
jgi:hypothetical protein